MLPVTVSNISVVVWVSTFIYVCFGVVLFDLLTSFLLFYHDILISDSQQWVLKLVFTYASFQNHEQRSKLHIDILYRAFPKIFFWCIHIQDGLFFPGLNSDENSLAASITIVYFVLSYIVFLGWSCVLLFLSGVVFNDDIIGRGGFLILNKNNKQWQSFTKCQTYFILCFYMRCCPMCW